MFTMWSISLKPSESWLARKKKKSHSWSSKFTKPEKALLRLSSKLLVLVRDLWRTNRIYICKKCTLTYVYTHTHTHIWKDIYYKELAHVIVDVPRYAINKLETPGEPLI